MTSKKHSRKPIPTVSSKQKNHSAVSDKSRVSLLLVLLLIPLVVLLAYTFFDSFSQNFKPSPQDFQIKVRQTPQELAEQATRALEQGDTPSFMQLAEGKIQDPNIVNAQGDSLLIAAATHGNVEAAQWLLAAGADVNKQNYNTGDTAILRSITNDHDDVTQLLVYAKANLNLTNNYQQTPLELAIEKQKWDLVQLFLRNGVKAGLNGQTLLRSSATQNFVGVFGMLKGGVNPNVKNEKGNTPLIISASLGDSLSVQNLLAYQADVNQANNEGNTPLIYAARYNHPQTVLILFSPLPMQDPVNVNAQNKKGETALYWAALKGYAPIVKILLAYDADKNIPTKEGITPLDIATHYNRQAVLDLMDMDLNELKKSFNQEQEERIQAAKNKEKFQ